MILTGIGFMQHLYDLGIIPKTTRRVVIDAAMDDVVRIYVEQRGDRRLLNVVATDLLGAQIIMEEKRDGNSDTG